MVGRVNVSLEVIGRVPAVPAWALVLASIALVNALNVVGINSVAHTSNLIVGAQMWPAAWVRRWPW